MQLTLINWLLALLPIITVLILMLGFRWGGSKAGAIAWLVAILVAALRFGAGLKLIAYSQGKALFLTLDVLYIIWTALLLFHTANEAGAVQVIGDRLPALTGNRVMQALLLSWLFVSFLQGMGGFGVPVAVAAPLLVGIGFTPMQSVVMASIGHAWAVTFGSLGTSFATLMATTGLPDKVLAPDAALLLGISSLTCGMVVAHVTDGWRGIWRGLPALLIISPVMAVVQYLLATNGMWALGATGAGLIGLVVGVGVTRLPIYRNKRPVDDPALDLTPDLVRSSALDLSPLQYGEGEGESPSAARKGVRLTDQPRSLILALSGYGVLIVLAFAIKLIPPVQHIFDVVRLTLHFPELSTSLGWVTPAEDGRVISLFGHTGAILLYSSAIAYLIYHRAGYYQPGALRRISKNVLKGAVKSSLGIAAMVGMATVMSHAGMTNLIARGLSDNVGPAVYPAIAPFIGALGAFMTGSNTNSNVVFAVLQMQTAQLLGLSVPLILGAQTAGGALGSVFAPAKTIVGCSTVGLAGQEGPVIAKKLRYGLITISVVAILTWLLVVFR